VSPKKKRRASKAQRVEKTGRTRKIAAPRRSQAVLVALDATGKRVKRQTMSLVDYYDDLHDLLDSKPYRLLLEVRRLRGELYDAKGERYQSWENVYSARGQLVLSRVVNADGTVHEEHYRSRVRA
jgi:hypothetical protein